MGDSETLPVCSTVGVVKAETPVTNTSKMNIVRTNFQSARDPWSLQEEKEGGVSRGGREFPREGGLGWGIGCGIEQGLDTAPENENACCIYFQIRKFNSCVFVSPRLCL